MGLVRSNSKQVLVVGTPGTDPGSIARALQACGVRSEALEDPPGWDEISPAAPLLVLYRRPWDYIDETVGTNSGGPIDPLWPVREWQESGILLIDLLRRHVGIKVALSSEEIAASPEATSLLLADLFGLPAVPAVAIKRLKTLEEGDPFRDLVQSRARRAVELYDTFERYGAHLGPEGKLVLGETPFPLQQSILIGGPGAGRVNLRVPSEIDPVLSVVIPSFNDGQFLGEAVASAALIDVPGEIIIVDDCSTDPATILAYKALEDLGCMVIHRESNGGPSSACRSGIQASRGRYVVTVGSDDQIRPQLASRAVEVMEADDHIGVVYADVELFGDRHTTFEYGPFDELHFLAENQMGACSIIRRAAWIDVGGHADEYTHAEDWRMWSTLFAAGWKFHYLKGPHWDYRIHGRSFSTELFHPDEYGSAVAEVVRAGESAYQARLPEVVGRLAGMVLREHQHGEEMERQVLQWALRARELDAVVARITNQAP